jgi:divalent metal cation (Fe/Co/Zn/Cd) transporter
MQPLVQLGGFRKRHARGFSEAEPLLSEARMTRVDGWLACGVLAALAANALFSWWWADPLAGAAVALLAARESHVTWTRTTDAASARA